MLRIATSGWLTIGVWKSPASLPALDTVNVEPRRSSAPSEPVRARSARAAISAASSSTDFSFAAPDDRHHETVVGLHGDPDVVAIEVEDRVAVEARVQLRELDERVGARLHDCREEALERNVLEVTLLHPGHGWHLAMRPGHVLGDHAADASQGLASAFGARARRGRSHVVLRDPAARPGARDLGEVDTELLRDPTDDRSRLHAPRIRDRSGGGLRGNGCGRRSDHGHRLSRLADHDELRADGGDVTLRHEDLQHRAGVRRRDLDRRLVGLDLDERVVLGDLLPLGDEPAGDLALREPLAEVGKLERARH